VNIRKSILAGEWQADRERAANSFASAHTDPTAVFFDDLSRAGKSNASSSDRPDVGAAPEQLEYVR
jgi:hypothetical protein